MPHEERTIWCDQCKYFFPEDDEHPYGWCMRHAPRRHDFDTGIPAGGTELGMFARIEDRNLIACGEFERWSDWVSPGYVDRPPT
jgi:hypothetical protein